MTHRTHETRFSDSSFYDEVCKLCGAHDGSRRGIDQLEAPCKDPRACNCAFEGSKHAALCPALARVGSDGV